MQRYISAMQKTQNGSDWQVVADFHFKNSAINENLFGKSKQCLRAGPARGVEGYIVPGPGRVQVSALSFGIAP